jgi:2-iminobutanoate/2-iminopropanoate deaminase
MREPIQTDTAPAAIGPYSQAIRVTDLTTMAFFSGQIALDPASGKLVTGDITTECRQVLMNLQAVVEASGFALTDVVKTTIYLQDMADFPQVNGIYAQFFDSAPPARATVAVAGLPLGVRVEIDAICAR